MEVEREERAVSLNVTYTELHRGVLRSCRLRLIYKITLSAFIQIKPRLIVWEHNTSSIVDSFSLHLITITHLHLKH